MAQHDLDVANGSGAAIRADMNLALAALGSTMKGPNAPPAPVAGMVWVEDDNPSSSVWTLKIYDGADWITIGTVDSSNNRFVFNGLFSGTAASAPGIAPAGDSNTGLFSPSGDVLAVATGGTERMRFTSAMRCVIGATAASSLFHVSNSTDTTQTATVRVENTNASGGYAEVMLQDVRGATDQERVCIRNLAGLLQVGMLNDAETTFTERMRIETSGVVRIAATADAIAAGETLSVRGSVGAKNPTAGTPGLIAASSNDTTVCAWYSNAGSVIGSITSTGGASVAYNTTSDARLKIVDGAIADAGPLIDAVEPVWHRWQATPSAPAIPGFLAQELAPVVPHAVSTGRGEPGDADFIPMQVDASRLVALLWAEVRSLRARVAALEA